LAEGDGHIPKVNMTPNLDLAFSGETTKHRSLELSDDFGTD
jgi:hypothetical protein